MPSARWTLRTLVAIVALAPFDIGVLVGDEGARIRPIMFVALALPLIAFAEGRLVTSQDMGTLRDTASPQTRRIDWGDRFVIAWLIAVWVSTLLASESANAVAFAFRFTVLGAVIHGVRHVLTQHQSTVRTSKDVLLRWFVLGAALAAVVGVAVLLVGGDPFPTRFMQGSVTRLGTTDRLTRPWPHANVAAMALGAALPAALVVRVGARWAFVAPIASALVLTYSRGAIVGFVASSIVVIVAARSRHVAARVVVVAAGAALLMAVSPGWAGRGATDSDQTWFDATIDHPPELVPGTQSGASIGATNGSSATWQPNGPDAIELSARWIAPGPDGETLAVWFEQTWPLDTPVAPGQEARWEVTPAARLPAGSYEIYWDLLRDNEAYFLQFSDRSATTTWVVAAQDTADAAASPVLFVPRVQDLGRVDLWTHTLGVFGDAPIFGAGPGQLPGAAADRITPQQQIAGGHAHNLWLEVLATTGIAGASALAGIVAVAVGRVVRRVRRDWQRADRSAERIDVWSDRATLGSLAALLAHGLVDLPLMFQGTLIPLGLLLGLALGERTSDAAEEAAQIRVN